MAGGEEPLRDEAGSRRDVEHACPPSRGTCETIARRQRGSWPNESGRADAVVARAERREELAGVVAAVGQSYPAMISILAR